MSLIQKALQYYDVVQINNKERYVCHFCNNDFSGKQRSNLVVHLRSIHSPEYKMYIEPESVDPTEIAIKHLKKIQCYTEIVTINGRPFSTLSLSGFVKSQQDDLDELKRNGYTINLKAKKYTEIKKYISETAAQVRSYIQNEAKGLMVSLMLDTATKNRESILGIYARYILNDKIEERCIGMLPLYLKHSAINLANTTIDCAAKFGIHQKQIATITTDNASNVVAIVDHMDDNFDNSDDDLGDNNFIDENHDTEELDIETVNDITNSMFNLEIQKIASARIEEEAIEKALDDSIRFEELMIEVAGKIHHYSDHTFHVRCGAHTVQLVVRGGIKKSNFHDILLVCRKATCLLSTQKYTIEMRENNVYEIIPRIGNDTRWDGDYRMVNI